MPGVAKSIKILDKKTAQSKITQPQTAVPKVLPKTEPKKNIEPKIQTQAPVVSTPTITEPKPVISETQKSVYNPNSRAMIDYKTKLRAKLFSKFAVGSIQGSGTCSIQFSVDKSGKLINRKFTQESNNKSLNDTVYYMLMSVPYFTSPPSEYDGSPINMTFSINNGNYEISIN